MFHFLHTFLPQPILFQLGPLQVHWYGLFIVLAIVAGLIITAVLGRRRRIFFDDIIDLAFYAIIFGIIGGRIYAVLLDVPYYAAHPGEIIAVWRGGMAIHGAVIAGILTLLAYCAKKRQSFWLWADLLAPALALGQGIGRWGNYFNQEIFGPPTALPWGIPIAAANRPPQYLDATYFQPTFLYESILDLLNFFILLFLFSKLQATSYKLKSGIVFFVYLINYSIIRIIMELLRTDQTPLLFGIRLPIIVSGLIIILSFGLVVFKSHQKLSAHS